MITPQAIVVHRPPFPLLIALGVLASLVMAGCTPPGELPDNPTPSQYARHALREMEKQGYWVADRSEQWQKAKQSAQAQADSASTIRDTWPALREALRVAGGPHSTIDDDGIIERAIDEPTISVNDRTARLTVPSTSGADGRTRARHADVISRGIKDTPSVCGWLVDLRSSDAGDVYWTLAGLASLLPDGPLVDVWDAEGRLGSIVVTGTDVEYNNAVQARAPSGDKRHEPVAVLINGDTAGATEVAALVLQQRDDAMVFGAVSRGRWGVASPVPLPDDSHMLVVSRMLAAHDREPLSEGLSPDAPGGEAEAVAWLRKRCG